MNIDEELAKAIEGEPTEEPVPQRTRRVTRRVQKPTPKRNLGLLLGLIAVVVVVLALLPLSFKGSAVWATTVDQLVADESMLGRRVRVEGSLVPGTLMKRDEPCEFRFKLSTADAVVEVRYAQCVVPDSLQDRPEAVVNVTAEGTLREDGVFEATHILAKCPSKYEEQDGKSVPMGELELR